MKAENEKSNYFVKDDVEINSLWGFDYCFCHSDCKNAKCGRNTKSKSFKVMMCQPDDTIYSASDFSKICKRYK